MRRAARTDANHIEIKQAFEKLGCWVWDMSGVGGGFPDLMVVRMSLKRTRQAVLIEIKTPLGRIKPHQEEFARNCPLPCMVARTLADVEAVVKALA